MNTEKNNIDVPEYLNKDFFESTLEKGLNEKNIKVKSIIFTMGSAPGDNYTSKIFRTEITYSGVNIPETKKFLIIKSIPNEESRDFMKELDLHGTESLIYFDLLPKMEKYLHNEKFSAKCYTSCNEPFQTIVFDDLKTSGYRLADREMGLDEAHSRLVLIKLAKFHAISMILAEQDSTKFEILTKGCFTSVTIKSDLLNSLYIGSLKAEIKVVGKWPGFENIVVKLEKLCKTFMSKAVEITRPTKGELKVLNHGDLWTSNILFQYADENSAEPLDLAFVDYQGSFYVSPGIDINFFLNTSVQLDVLKTRRDYIIKEYYYKTLQSTLEEYNYTKIPTLDDILYEINRKELYGIIAAIGELPITSMNRADSTDNSLECFADEDIAKSKLDLACSTKRVQDSLKYMLVRADKLGLLD